MVLEKQDLESEYPLFLTGFCLPGFSRGIEGIQAYPTLMYKVKLHMTGHWWPYSQTHSSFRCRQLPKSAWRFTWLHGSWPWTCRLCRDTYQLLPVTIVIWLYHWTQLFCSSQFCSAWILSHKCWECWNLWQRPCPTQELRFSCISMTGWSTLWAVVSVRLIESGSNSILLEKVLVQPHQVVPHPVSDNYCLAWNWVRTHRPVFFTYLRTIATVLTKVGMLSSLRTSSSVSGRAW